MQLFSLFINFVLSLALIGTQVPITIHRTEIAEPEQEPAKALTITNKNVLKRKEERLSKTIKKVESEDSQEKQDDKEPSSDAEEKTESSNTDTVTSNTSEEKDTSEDESLDDDTTTEEEELPEIKVNPQEAFCWDGPVITPDGGTCDGPSGFETYYNLPMGGVVQIMRELGYSEEEYPYWVRDDGCKMLGDYIMVAANLDIRPEGTILPCSRGMAMVCDTGTFALTNRYQLDIAVNW